jgi:hypothetical protein
MQIHITGGVDLNIPFPTGRKNFPEGAKKDFEGKQRMRRTGDKSPDFDENKTLLTRYTTYS